MKFYLTKSRSLIPAFASLFFLITTSAYAATWKISNITVQYNGGGNSTYNGAQPFQDGQFVLSYITPSLNPAVGVNFGTIGGNSSTIGFSPVSIYDASYLLVSQPQAPTVNLSSMTIDVSSMYFYGWGPATSGPGYQTMIGGPIAPLYSPYSAIGNPYGYSSNGISLQYAGINCVASVSNPVVDPSCLGIIPIINNNNGTYTASWYSTLNAYPPGPGTHYTMTFAQVVPLPASLWLLCSGLLSVMVIARKRKAA